MKVSFLDIGQGDAILIQTPSMQNILVDGGPDNKILEHLGNLLPILNDQIDMMILTHPHKDHIFGLIEVVKRYEVKQILISGINFKNSFYDEFLKEINKKNIKLTIASSDKDYNLGNGIYFDILYPNESMLGKNIQNVNNSSVAFKLVYSNSKILFTGDNELESETKELLSDFDFSANILKAGHHGSRTSSSLPYLMSVKPQTTVIQSGLNNEYNHPHSETLENLKNLNITVRRNDLEGNIIFLIKAMNK